MSASNIARGPKPSNTRRPSVRFAETAQTIFSIQDEDQPEEENEEADLGGSRQNEAVGAAAGVMGSNHHSHSDDTSKRPASLSSTPSPPAKYRTSYGLKSTASSREAEFEADDSDVEEADESAETPTIAMPAMHRARSSSLSMPLIDRIPGLPMAMDRARRSISEGANHNLRESLRNAMDSEELPDWLRRGAGILDSTWNMSNSILGAGVVGESRLIPVVEVEAEYLAKRAALLAQGVRMFDWAGFAGRNSTVDRLDYPADCPQCKAVWPANLHRHYESLLWPKWKDSRVDLPGRICLWRHVCFYCE